MDFGKLFNQCFVKFGQYLIQVDSMRFVDFGLMALREQLQPRLSESRLNKQCIFISQVILLEDGGGGPFVIHGHLVKQVIMHADAHLPLTELSKAIC